MTPEQLDEHLFWLYQEAKSRWRKHMSKPTRKVRRFIRKRRNGRFKGKGKGKGHRRFAFLSEMSDEDYDSVFYGGKGKSKGKSRTSGKGKGRRKNPRGYDGQIMTCSICGSDEHLRARCPRNTASAAATTGGSTAPASFGAYVDSGPLAGVAGVAFLASATEVTVSQRSSTPSVNLIGSWENVGEDVGSWSTVTAELNTVMLGAAAMFGTPSAGGLSQPPWVSATTPFVPMTATAPSMPPFIPMAATAPAAPASAPPTYHIGTPPSVGASTLPAVPPFPAGNTPAWDQRATRVLQAVSDHEPSPAAGTLALADRPASSIPMLADFRNLSQLRQQQQIQRGQQMQPRPEQHSWQHLALTPAGAVSDPRPMISVETATGIVEVNQLLQLTDQQMEARRAQRRQRVQAAVSELRAPAPADAAPAHAASQQDGGFPTVSTGDPCGICLQDMEDMEWVTTLRCAHRFHQECIDQWCAHLYSEARGDLPITCPVCRAEVTPMHTTRAALDEVYLNDHDWTPRQSTDSRTTPQVEQSTPDRAPSQEVSNTPQGSANTPFQSPFASPGQYEDDTSSSWSGMFTAPWWPAPGTEPVAGAPYYHAATQLPDGQLSMIIDPGAWTNLMGVSTAKQLSERAVKAGHTPTQEQMPRPLNVQGVGNGTQQCRYQLKTPIAVPDQTGKATLHSITIPIVEGAGGAEIPGLLGLRSMESLRAVLDMGRHELILPGAGEIETTYPPGTTRIPLRKAPSGHLVMVIDDYERALKASGLPERSLELLAEVPESAVEPQAPEPMPSGPEESFLDNEGAQAAFEREFEL